jgi:hypothetical protein
VGGADTSIPDPYFPNCLIDCFVTHAFDWHNGVLTDLGALPGVDVSFALASYGLGGEEREPLFRNRTRHGMANVHNVHNVH